ncbi:hypothetical protein MBANPS3_004665 [Mucor bainieri]
MTNITNNAPNAVAIYNINVSAQASSTEQSSETWKSDEPSKAKLKKVYLSSFYDDSTFNNDSNDYLQAGVNEGGQKKKIPLKCQDTK